MVLYKIFSKLTHKLIITAQSRHKQMYFLLILKYRLSYMFTIHGSGQAHSNLG